MERFPISYDAPSNALLLSKEGGAEVMLALLIKAKFGEAFDPETLFHKPLAELMNSLREKTGRPPRSDGPFTREQLIQVADEIVSDSWQSGWWSLTPEEMEAFVQDVIVAPHRLSAEQMAELMSDVQDALAARRRVVAAAEGVAGS